MTEQIDKKKFKIAVYVFYIKEECFNIVVWVWYSSWFWNRINEKEDEIFFISSSKYFWTCISLGRYRIYIPTFSISLWYIVFITRLIWQYEWCTNEYLLFVLCYVIAVPIWNPASSQIQSHSFCAMWLCWLFGWYLVLIQSNLLVVLSLFCFSFNPKVCKLLYRNAIST